MLNLKRITKRQKYDGDFLVATAIEKLLEKDAALKRRMQLLEKEVEVLRLHDAR